MAMGSERKRRKRRTCADWMRRDLGRRRRNNPANTTVLKLLGLLTTVLLQFPEPGRGNSPRPDRRTPPLDYDLGPDAWARERGLEPTFYPPNKPKPRRPWSRLIKDLSRRKNNDQARKLITERVPPEALGWLHDAIRREDWISLRLLGHDRNEDEIREMALVEAIRWEAERGAPQAPPPSATDDAGNAAPPAGPKPRF
jgi:hypothetical protein